MTLQLLFMSWALGVLMGFYFRDCHLKGYLMSPRTFVRLWAAPTLVKIGIVFTSLMLAVTILSGVSWFRASNAIDDAANASRQSSALASCQTRATEDALTLWRSWKKQFSKEGQSQSEEVRRALFFASLDDYIASLELLQRARVTDDPAKVCEGR